MPECKHLKDCGFVLRYVALVKPHWDDFVSLYCNGEFQENCKRLEQFREHGTCPDSGLMPTGHRVPPILEQE
jgi:hypothetical protein